MRSLEDVSVVGDFEVLDFKTFESGWYYKIKVVFTDGSVLHAREYVDDTERNYAFHWQDAEQPRIDAACVSRFLWVTAQLVSKQASPEENNEESASETRTGSLHSGSPQEHPTHSESRSQDPPEGALVYLIDGSTPP